MMESRSEPSLRPTVWPSNIRWLHLFVGLDGFNLTRLLFSYHLIDRMAGDTSRVAFVLGLQSMAAVACEFPSGVLADVVGCRITLLASCLVRLVGLGVLWIESRSFDIISPTLAFSVVALCNGCYQALASGTDVAMMRDSCGTAVTVAGSLATRSSLWLGCTAAAHALDAWFLYDASFDKCIGLAVAVTIASLAAILQTTEIARPPLSSVTQRSTLLTRMQHHMTACKQVLFRDNTSLWSILVFMGIIGACSDPLGRLRGLLFARHDISKAQQRHATAWIFGIGAIGSAMSSYIGGNEVDALVCTIGQLTTGIGLLYTSTLWSTTAVVFGVQMLAISLLLGMRAPLLSRLMTAQLQGQHTHRATMDSIRALLYELCMAIAMLGVAGPLAAASFSIDVTLLVFALASICVPLVFSVRSHTHAS